MNFHIAGADITSHSIELTGEELTREEFRNTVFLTDFGCVRISGSDSLKFLNGLSTSDLKKLADQSGSPALLLNSEGKFFVLVYVFRLQEDLLVFAPSAKLEIFLQYLDFYHIRENTNFQIMEGPRLLVSHSSSELPQVLTEGNILDGPGSSESGENPLLMGKKITGQVSLDHFRYFLDFFDQSLDLRQGYPHHLGLRKYVSFTKGCFIGQEPVARMEHKTLIRKTLSVFYSTSDLNPGEEFSDESAKATLLSVNRGKVGGFRAALAEVRYLSENLSHGVLKSHDGKKIETNY